MPGIAPVGGLVKGPLDKKLALRYCYFQVRPERASIVLKVTQRSSRSQPGLCAIHRPRTCLPHTHLAASRIQASKLPQGPGMQRKREVTIKAYQTACRRQPQISVAK